MVVKHFKLTAKHTQGEELRSAETQEQAIAESTFVASGMSPEYVLAEEVSYSPQDMLDMLHKLATMPSDERDRLLRGVS